MNELIPAEEFCSLVPCLMGYLGIDLCTAMGGLPEKGIMFLILPLYFPKGAGNG